MVYETSEIRTWKKVFENDLDNIVIELKEAAKSPSVIILQGPVGAGKTTFTKIFAEQSKSATSPTYSIINEVENIVHADFYRLENPEDIMHLEIPLYLEGKDYFLVEWGKEYFDGLYREVGDGFKFYELEIVINEANAAQIPSRNFLLKQIKM